MNALSRWHQQQYSDLVSRDRKRKIHFSRSASLTLVLARRLKKPISTCLVLVAMMILIQRQDNMATVIGSTLYTYGKLPRCIACINICHGVYMCVGVRFHP